MPNFICLWILKFLYVPSFNANCGYFFDCVSGLSFGWRLTCVCWVTCCGSWLLVEIMFWRVFGLHHPHDSQCLDCERLLRSPRLFPRSLVLQLLFLDDKYCFWWKAMTLLRQVAVPLGGRKMMKNIELWLQFAFGLWSLRRVLGAPCNDVRWMLMNFFSVIDRSCFLRSFGKDSNYMCYAVVEGVTFCQVDLA